MGGDRPSRTGRSDAARDSCNCTVDTGEGWEFATIWESHASRFPDALAILYADQRRTWQEFDSHANGIAAVALTAGLGHQDKVALYLHDSPEHLESIFAVFKAGLVPVNTNIRYTHDELAYLWTNADVAAVVFHGCFSTICGQLRASLPGMKLWLWVDDGTTPCPSWAQPYDRAALSEVDRVRPEWERTGDDLYLLYTGGTTGQPKGVMWRQDDLVMLLDGLTPLRLPEEPCLHILEERLTAPGPVVLTAAPLMHGTGAWFAMAGLQMAGTVVTLPSGRFNANALLDTIERHRVERVAIVGDAFAKPILAALDAQPSRWDLSSLEMIFSAGAMWGAACKSDLLKHLPTTAMVDSFGSSESGGSGRSVTTGDAASDTAIFRLSPTARLLDENHRDVAPGSGRRGLVAAGGRIPLGYYKDPARTAETFVNIDGHRYAIAGDWAEACADGSFRLIGRGSICINTGGEKVAPEEVEEALKTCEGVADAAVVGLPDDRFGETVIALVEPRQGWTVDGPTVIAHVTKTLAGYKAPKRVLIVDSVGRGPNGKLDYRRLKFDASRLV